MSNYKYRTAESVSPRHPDKICDRISDAILDAFLEQDEDSRIAVDVAGGHGIVFITGEVTSKAKSVDYEGIVRRIAGDEINLITKIESQSPDIARGVDDGGAGDQGIMIGYATSATKQGLPLETILARELNKRLYSQWQFDGKTQVTLKDNQISSIVASFQNSRTKDLTQAINGWISEIVKEYELATTTDIQILANPSGEWSLGGFDADAGLTGRKLVVDNYGPLVPVGGGAFSGKDPSKVDRSAAYIARRVATDYLRHTPGAKEVYVRLAYAIGYRDPLESTVIIDGVSQKIEAYDLTPDEIIDYLKLKQPIYEKTAEYGHFGNGFVWDI